MPSSSPQSAGFSIAHAAPVALAASTRSAEKAASALCFWTYRRQRAGTGCTPSGSVLLRSRG
eukprot:1157335-Pleurochrysis_carterae.AAC.1